MLNYVSSVFGKEWGDAEIKKPFSDRHPILQWYDMLCSFQQKNLDESGKVQSNPMTGAVAAYLRLAYNLYLLGHNNEIQTRLIGRLKNPDQFHGAHYETYVAAILIKAGFELTFEDEADGSRSHCEFTAKHKETGKEFSVEAKARMADKDHHDVGNHLYNAVRKRAKYELIVFININVPAKASEEEEGFWLKEALNSLRDRETSLKIGGNPAPSAYVFITNHPYQYSLKGTNFRSSGVAEGFKIPDFKLDKVYASIREAIRSRENHLELEQLLKSMKTHYEIPSTFDGEIPEFAFEESKARLKIGQIYEIPDGEVMVPGELVDALVMEDEKTAYCIYRLDDGRTIILTDPLSDTEISAYRKHLDTFFGVIKPIPMQVKGPIDAFDFLFHSFRHTPKEKLLELLEGHSDFEKLVDESQEELAIIYSERTAYSMMATSSSPNQTSNASSTDDQS